MTCRSVSRCWLKTRPASMSKRTVPSPSRLHHLGLDGRIGERRENLRGNADRGHAGLHAFQGEPLDGLDLLHAAGRQRHVDVAGLRPHVAHGDRFGRQGNGDSPLSCVEEPLTLCFCASDLPVRVERDGRKRDAHRGGDVFKARRGGLVGAAVVANLRTAGELLPDVDSIDAMLEHGRAVGADFLHAPGFLRKAGRLGVLRAGRDRSPHFGALLDVPMQRFAGMELIAEQYFSSARTRGGDEEKEERGSQKKKSHTRILSSKGKKYRGRGGPGSLFHHIFQLSAPAEFFAERAVIAVTLAVTSWNRDNDCSTRTRSPGKIWPSTRPSTTTACPDSDAEPPTRKRGRPYPRPAGS